MNPKRTIQHNALRIGISVILLAACQTGFAQTGLTLNNALEIAETNSPNIRKAQLGLVRSQELLAAQKASLKSNFSLRVTPFSYSQNRDFNELTSRWLTTQTTQSSGSFNILQPIMATDATIRLTNSFNWRDSYSEYSDQRTTGFFNNLSISLDQPIFTYNRTKMNLRELELSLENAEISYRIQRLNLEAQVASRFYQVYQQQQRLDIAYEAYQSMLDNYEIIKVKADAGLAAQVELFQAELNLANTRSDYENSRVTLENTKDNLKLLLGMSLYDDIIVIPDISVDTVSIDVGFAIDQGLANRMELRQRDIELQTAEFNLTETKASNEFKGSIGLSLGLSGDNKNLMDIYSNPTDNQAVSVSLNIPLWDWGARDSRIKASEAGIETSKINYEEEENNIIINIRNTYRNLINLKNQIEIAEQSVTNAELTYEINLERYRNGDLTGMDLNKYQEQLSQSQLSYTNALINYKLELLNMKIQTLYDFEKREPVSPLIIDEY